MKKLILITLFLGLSSFIYAGCGDCGPNSCGADKKTAEKSECSKDKSSCDTKEKKTSCCPSK
jgi:hypothetical protein